MQIQQIGVTPPVDPHQEIVDQVLEAPLESLVIAKQGKWTTDVILRTGSDGWLTTNRGDAYSSRGGYWKSKRVEAWAREHLSSGATLHLVDTRA